MKRIKKNWNVFIPFILGTLIWMCPIPEGLTPKAWHVFAIFVSTIVGIIAKSFTMGEMTIISMVTLLMTRTISIDESLAGFSNPVVWIVLGAYLISKAFIKTGLGMRIAYSFMSVFGKRALGLSYGFGIADLILSPTMPSITARSGGVILPILLSTSQAYGSRADDGSASKLGRYLVLCAFQCNVVTSALFITSHAPNSLMAQLAAANGADISWYTWALAASVPGLISLCLVPIITYWISPPEMKLTPEAPKFARKKLKELGPVSRSEWTMIGIFFLLLILWIFGAQLKVHATTVALLGVALLIITKILSWDDIIQEKSAWDTMIWFALLLMMAQSLTDSGLMKWFTLSTQNYFVGLSPSVGLILLAIIYFYMHYFFASNTAHITALYTAFLLLSIGIGVPPMLAALVFSFLSGLMGGLTHYSNTPAPILFGTHYVPLGTWWKTGFILSVCHLTIWLTIGIGWWKFLGLF